MFVRPLRRALRFVLPAMLFAGCGAQIDPRCGTLCQIRLPDVDGAYDVCNQDSADQCKRDCSARIAGTATVCASCLLQGACFGCSTGTNDVTCTQTQCTITGRVGSCNYPPGDMTALQSCERQVYPRREVSCTTTYQDVTKCASVCK